MQKQESVCCEARTIHACSCVIKSSDELIRFHACQGSTHGHSFELRGRFPHAIICINAVESSAYHKNHKELMALLGLHAGSPKILFFCLRRTCEQELAYLQHRTAEHLCMRNWWRRGSSLMQHQCTKDSKDSKDQLYHKFCVTNCIRNFMLFG